MPQRTVQRACIAAILVALAALATPAQAADLGGPPEISSLLLRAWEWLVDRVAPRGYRMAPASPQSLWEKGGFGVDPDGGQTQTGDTIVGMDSDPDAP